MTHTLFNSSLGGSLVLSLALGATCLVGTTMAAESHPYDINDQVRMRRLSNPQLSPDGKQIAFELRSTDYDANRGRLDIWLVGIDGSGMRQLTNHPENDTTPTWSADGKSLYFISSRSGSDQIWQLDLAGGDPRQVSDLPLDVANLKLSPDGKSFVFSLEVFPGQSIKETASALEQKSKSKMSGRIYDQLLYRHWDSWSDGRRNHLFTMPVTGGEPRDLMPQMAADSPSRPHGGSEEFSISADSKSVAFACRDVGREEAWSTDLDIFMVPLDGSAPPKKLTTTNRATDTQPSFSPDGKTLAYLAMRRPVYEADRLYIVLRDLASGAERTLAESWDRSPSSIDWSRDSKSLLVTADEVGQHSLFSINALTGKVATLAAEGHVDTAAMAADGTIVYALHHLRSPADLYTVRGDGSGAHRITNVNAEALAAIRFGEPEHISFTGANNDKVWAWIVKPVDFDPAKKYPVAFLVHGGPQGSFGNDFHYRWNPQIYAAAGFAAVMVDFHGSTGYGQAFTDAIRDNWGGWPLIDLQKGLDAALAKFPWMDGSRVAALGASYGGYMMNWIAGNWPDRFRCIVNHDGVFDTRIGYYDTEEVWFPEWEHAGTPWEKPEAFEKWNPANHVGKWKTPMLVIHSSRDYRVVETQGISAFTALQRRGIPSKFLNFPDENHWVLKPQNSVYWHETVLDWLRTWTK